MKIKPLGYKNYGSIPHLPNSRLGVSDKMANEGHVRIATVKLRDKHDEVIVQEKLDGSNVGVAKINDVIYPLTRSGYIANTSPYLQHKYFHNYVYKNYSRFYDVLNNGERLVGEWLLQAHGTRYDLKHEPFVVFDLMVKDKRSVYDELLNRVKNVFVTPKLLHRGTSISVKNVLKLLGEYGHHGALDKVEGAVWRIERNKVIDKKGSRKKVIDFLVKYVRIDKIDGCYLPEQSGCKTVYNYNPEKLLEN